MNGRGTGIRRLGGARHPESGRLNRALRRMAQNGYGQEARPVLVAIRNLQPLDGADTARSRAIPLMVWCCIAVGLPHAPWVAALRNRVAQGVTIGRR
jgi:hypothetical protein